MGAAAGPNVVEDGLVLALDAGNSKSWNVGVSTNWTDMIGSNDGTFTNGQLHSQGPFPGAGSVFFDGQGNHTELDVIHTSSLSADFDLSGNISSTVECWVYLNSYPLTTTGGSTPHYSGATIFSIKNTSNQLGKYYRYSVSSSGQLRMRADYGDGFPTTGYSTSTLSLNTWYHIAWVRDSGSNRFFLNGTEITSEFSTPNDSDLIGSGNSKISIGADYYQSTGLNWIRPITGYISNFRVVKGSALYTSNFTPFNFTVPTKPLTAVPNTVLLTCQGSSITDASSSAHTLSSNGGPTATYNVAPYFDFDGTNDYVTIPDSEDLEFGSGDFTIEAYIYPTGVPSNFGYACIFAKGLPLQCYFMNTNSLSLFVDSANDGTPYSIIDNTNITGNNTVNQDEWTHIAICRSGDTWKVFTGGVQRYSATHSGTIANTTSDFSIGYFAVGAGTYPFQGRISNLKVYKGKALTAAEVQQNHNALKGRYEY